VLEWLSQVNFVHLAPVFAAEGIESLRTVALMDSQDMDYILCGGENADLSPLQEEVFEFSEQCTPLPSPCLSASLPLIVRLAPWHAILRVPLC